MSVVQRIAEEYGVFRARDVMNQGASSSSLEDACVCGFVKPHGHGVWSHIDYNPTRYELVQVRMRKAVFWGPSALWLHGEAETEPDELWIAFPNNFPRPKGLDLGTIVIRTRNLEQDVQLIRQPRTCRSLRVHSVERARADVEKNDCRTLADRDLAPRFFTVDPEGCLLSAQLRDPARWSAPVPEYDGVERWIVASSIGATKPKPTDRLWLRFRRH